MRHFLNPYRRLLNNDDSINYGLFRACERLMPRDLPNPLPALAQIRRWTFAPAPMQATVRQAMDIMRTNTAEAVCIDERSPNTGKQILHDLYNPREYRETLAGKYALIA